jgi:chromosome segregation ATPase
VIKTHGCEIRALHTSLSVARAVTEKMEVALNVREKELDTTRARLTRFAHELALHERNSKTMQEMQAKMQVRKAAYKQRLLEEQEQLQAYKKHLLEEQDMVQRVRHRF